MAISTSGTTLTSFTLTPIEFNHFANVDVFISCVLPDKISLPIINIAAVTFCFICHFLI